MLAKKAPRLLASRGRARGWAGRAQCLKASDDLVMAAPQRARSPCGDQRRSGGGLRCSTRTARVKPVKTSRTATPRTTSRPRRTRVTAAAAAGAAMTATILLGQLAQSGGLSGRDRAHAPPAESSARRRGAGLHRRRGGDADDASRGHSAARRRTPATMSMSSPIGATRGCVPDPRVSGLSSGAACS